MPMRGNALQRLFSGKLCFESQFEVTASCRRKRSNQILAGHYTLNMTNWGTKLSSLARHSLLMRVSIRAHPPCRSMATLAGLLDDVHVTHSNIKNQAADLI